MLRVVTFGTSWYWMPNIFRQPVGSVLYVIKIPLQPISVQCLDPGFLKHDSAVMIRLRGYHSSANFVKD